MGNILSALTDIETLERERECECKCDVDWPEEYYELRQRLERERDEARERTDTMFAKHAEILDQYRRERDEAREEIERIKKLLPDPNAVRINMRAEVVKRVENFAELVGFVGLEAFDMLHGKIAKLDWEELEHIHGPHPARDQLAAERALADRLAKALLSFCSSGMVWPNTDTPEKAIAAWKEARSE